MGITVSVPSVSLLVCMCWISIGVCPLSGVRCRSVYREGVSLPQELALSVTVAGVTVCCQAVIFFAHLRGEV